MTDPHVFKNGSSARRRAKRVLSAEEKLQVWLELVAGQSTPREVAAWSGVDPSTIMRIRRVAREGALAALAASRPGVSAQGEDVELVAARAEIARLEQAVKEQAIELVVLRGKQRSGW